jgi:hypothetical protein
LGLNDYFSLADYSLAKLLTHAIRMIELRAVLELITGFRLIHLILDKEG